MLCTKAEYPAYAIRVQCTWQHAKSASLPYTYAKKHAGKRIEWLNVHLITYSFQSLCNFVCLSKPVYAMLPGMWFSHRFWQDLNSRGFFFFKLILIAIFNL